MTPKIIPVIHYTDGGQALRNADRAASAGCDGVLLIEMSGRSGPLPAAAVAIRERHPRMLVGINFLEAGGDGALRACRAHGLDMTWTDRQPTHSADAPWNEAEKLRAELDGAPGHLVFVGVAFKHQRREPDPAGAARRALAHGFIPTTSGTATGVAAEIGRIADLRAAIGPDAPLAVASGITPDNVGEYAPYLSHVLVATGVSSSFHEFDPLLLARLVRAVEGGSE